MAGAEGQGAPPAGGAWRRLLARWWTAGGPPQPMTRGARHGFVVLTAAVLAVGMASTGASVAYANSTGRAQDKTIARLNAAVAQLRRQQLAACAFARDLGSVTLPAKPRPSRVGVLLVADSRAQWQALHCPGTLPPSPGLAHWEAVYHLPAS